MSATDTSPPPLGPSLSDEELMGQLAAGRQDALGPLHGRYASLVFNLAAQTLDRATAEEIVQDVFVAVWRKAGTFDPARGTFRAWVLRIAHLRVLNELRRRGRRPRVEPDPEGLRLASVPEPGPGPAEEAWCEHRRGIVRAAVAALPPPQRQALSLAFLEDLTHQQIADFLNLPVGTAKTRIRAGLQTLRAHLSPLFAGGLIVARRCSPSPRLREHAHQASLRRQGRAGLVTNSEVVPRRLGPLRPGSTRRRTATIAAVPASTLAVLTLSYLAPAPRGYPPGRIRRRWVLLGPSPRKTAATCARRGPHLKSRPRALKVTLEPLGTPHAPNGPPVIVWPNP